MPTTVPPVGSSWPFVGRHAELDRALAGAAQGRGVLVVGESGIGKTAFLRAVADRLAQGPPDPLEVTGHALSTTTPYAALPSALRGDGRSERPLAPSEVAGRMAAAMGLTPEGRPLLVVDDLHLVDEHSAAVVLELAARHRAVVLAGAQSLPLPDGGDRLWRAGHVDRIDLPGLDLDEVDAFLEAGLGGPVDSRAVLTFARRSQGNPLVLRELAVAALGSGALVQRRGWRLVEPPPVGTGARELVGRRLDGVAGSKRTALELVAATEPVLLAPVLELVAADVLDALESDQLVLTRPGPSGAEVATAHPLYGEILRATMPFVRLRRYRLDLALRFEASPDPRPGDLVRAALWRLEDGQPQDPQRLLTAARIARGTSLDVAERLARHAVDAGGGVEATVLLAQVLVHSGRGEEAAALAERLPPASLSSSDREALAYCAAMVEGLAVGDTAHGVELVERVLAGDPSASADLRALQSSLLAFDARHEEALAAGRDIVADTGLAAPTRALAAIGVVGAEYWLGHLDRAAAYADELAQVLRAAAPAVPYAEASVVLIAVCALLDRGDHGGAERRAEELRRRAVAADDRMALSRSDYLLGRVDLYRGQAESAAHRLRRCVTSMSRFDEFARRHVWGVLARAEAEAGHPDLAEEALAEGSATTTLKTYEPDWLTARAAVLASRLALGDAADVATWAASIASDQQQWGGALLAYHDAARYGAARAVLPALQRLPTVDGPLAGCLVAHVEALAADDAHALDAVALVLEDLGALAWARDTGAEAARAHARAGDPRAARASAHRAARLGERVQTPLPRWLLDLGEVGQPLTGRERQIALLAARGQSDRSIAQQLGISPRTVSTHLSRCYAKLGVPGREALAGVVDAGEHRL